MLRLLELLAALLACRRTTGSSGHLEWIAWGCHQCPWTMTTTCVKAGTQVLFTGNSHLIYIDYPGASAVRGKWVGSMNMEFVFSPCSSPAFCIACWDVLSCSSSSAYKHVNVPRAKQLFSLVSFSTAKQARSPAVQAAFALPAQEMGEVRTHSPVVVFGSSFLRPAETRTRSQHHNSRGCLLLASSRVDVLFLKSWGLQIPADIQEFLWSLSSSYKRGLCLMSEANM